MDKSLTLNFNESIKADAIEKKSVLLSNTKKKQIRCRRYQYTSFKMLNVEDEKFIFNETKAVYMISCNEICPDTKREHQHGYIELSKQMDFNTIIKILRIKDETIHLEECMGNQQQNIDYVKKDGIFREYGEIKKAGKRNDISTALKKYKTLNEFIKNEPDIYVRYRTGIEGYYRSQGIDYNPNDDKPLVIWLYGETGTGKSRSVRDFIKQKIKDGYRVWRRPLGEKSWFDGYAGQDIVFIDELRYNTYKFEDLLQLLDYDAPQVPIKGGFVSFEPKIILITSNQHPSLVYEYINEENKQQLVRRCDIIKEVKSYIPDLLINHN